MAKKEKQRQRARVKGMSVFTVLIHSTSIPIHYSFLEPTEAQSTSARDVPDIHLPASPASATVKFAPLSHGDTWQKHGVLIQMLYMTSCWIIHYAQGSMMLSPNGHSEAQETMTALVRRLKATMTRRMTGQPCEQRMTQTIGPVRSKVNRQKIGPRPQIRGIRSLQMKGTLGESAPQAWPQRFQVRPPVKARIRSDRDTLHCYRRNKEELIEKVVPADQQLIASRFSACEQARCFWHRVRSVYDANNSSYDIFHSNIFSFSSSLTACTYQVTKPRGVANCTGADAEFQRNSPGSRPAGDPCAGAYDLFRTALGSHAPFTNLDQKCSLDEMAE